MIIKRNEINTLIKRMLMAILAVAFFCIFSAPKTIHAETPAETGFSIEFIDVGQGDAALVMCDGHYMLVDGGDAKQSRRIYTILRKNAIDHLDVMVATHPDSDHIGGLSGALNYATVDVAYSPVIDHDTKTFNNLLKYLSRQGVSLSVPEAGDTFSLGSATVAVLGPIYLSSDANNNSIVLRIVYGDTSFLLMGDAETDEEYSILRSGQSIESTVIKIAHHGSKHSSGYGLIRRVDPEYAIISVGSDNTYGHPSEVVLSRLRDADVKTYRTDLQGDITCISDGKTVSVLTEKNEDANTLENAGDGQKSDIQAIEPIEQGNSRTEDRSLGAVVLDSGSRDSDAGMEESYVLNTNTRKFHYPYCKSVSKMKDKNKDYYTGSRGDVISQGYSPCKNCNP